ncbi:hypothetical protein EZV62_002320 [Acer yangbiense]|uniref:Retrovirus-related Pol polyprotein from transposon TNT 1-94-like beta-barrel domain-containing protein n=1 Tax=Acer yangbiense TaxID=1000413 RepID=A0A5C7IWS4_9ROSI|nr:hypothetical protein EZV62_002320 [Acer yangbiense]
MATKFKIEKLKGSNFLLWKMKMKMRAILMKDNCLLAIGDRLTENTDDNKWKEMDGNAVANLHLALADGVLSKLGHKIEENERAELLLQSLPDSYYQLIINLTNNILVEYLVFDDVAAAVLEEKSKRKIKEDRSKSSQQAEALTITRGRSTERDPSGSHNHDDGEVLYSEGNSAAEDRKWFADVWLLDSASIWHMTFRREWFHKYEPGSEGSVFMGNDHGLEIDGIGTIKIKMHGGTIRTIQEVRHMKGLKKNLLSLGQLDNLGCKTQIENEILQIVRGALVVMKAEKITSNLYMLKGETLQEVDSCVASTNHVVWNLP